MKSSSIFIIFLVVAIIGIVFYSMTGSVDGEFYEKIEKERMVKDEFMKSGEGSPFAKVKEDFKGLQYFPPNAKYRIVADLEPIENKRAMVLPTSDGKEKSYVEYAYATFGLDGVENKLLILEVVDPGAHKGTLFLAFADQTSAFETYGAGRYLDIKKTPGASTITLDFNEAYNPYCAYSDEFSCPLPPKENVLKVAIKAGEMNYHP